MVQKMWLPLALTLLAGACLVPAQAADKLSTVTPVADLVAEAELKIKDLEALLSNNESYVKAKKKGVPQAAGTLAVLAQGIAQHDEDSAWKKSAADIRDGAISIAKAGSYDDAKKGLDAVKAAAGGKAGGAKVEHAWDKLIDMDSLMSEVSARNGKFRKFFKTPQNHDAAARDASVLAVLALAIEADTHEVKDKADIEKWKKYSKELQVAMTKISVAIKAKKEADAKTLFTTDAAGSCGKCHTEIRDK